MDELKSASTTSSPYDFIVHVKDRLVNDRPTLIKFTNAMKAFHNQQIEIEDLLKDIKEILKGYDDIIEDFNDFLPAENKILLSTTSSVPTALVTPQSSKQSKKVKVNAPSSPVAKRKTARRSKSFEPVVFSPPTPIRTELPALTEVFDTAEYMASHNVGSINNDQIFIGQEAGSTYPITTQLEDSLKLFISKLIAKHTCGSMKYRKFLSIIEECKQSPTRMILEVIQLFALEDLDLLLAFANLLSEPNKQDLLQAIAEYQLTLTVQSPRKPSREETALTRQTPLTPTGVMHMAHHPVAISQDSEHEHTLSVTNSSMVTPPAKSAASVPVNDPLDSRSTGVYSLPSIHSVTSPHGTPTHSTTLNDTFDSLFPCSSPPEEQRKRQYDSQEEWQADQRRLQSYQYVFKVRAVLRDEPNTYRKFLNLLHDYKHNANMESLLTNIKSAFSPNHPELIAGFLQLLP